MGEMGKVYRGELPPEHILPPRPKPGTIMPDQDPAAVFERPKIEPQVKSKILCKKKTIFNDLSTCFNFIFSKNWTVILRLDLPVFPVKDRPVPLQWTVLWGLPWCLQNFLRVFHTIQITWPTINRATFQLSTSLAQREIKMLTKTPWPDEVASSLQDPHHLALTVSVT